MSATLIGVIIGVAVGLILYFFKRFFKDVDNSPFRKPDREFPWQWRKILEQKVGFYKRLRHKERKLFEYKVHVFLLNVRILGIQTEVSHEDRVLIAASAIIPIFRFKHWHYMGLKEVHLYLDKFLIHNSDAFANGLVGWGEMDGKMMLSKKALHKGYVTEEDGKNVGIHEFIHLLDKSDGDVDGILKGVMEDVDITPWLYIIQSKINEISLGDSDIREYGGVNEAEFLAVVGEYFVENPEKMKAEHPALYNALDSFFNPPKKNDNSKYTSDYEKCPCGSGKEYVECCKKNSQYY